MTIDEQFYNSLIQELHSSLDQEIETGKVKIKTHQYKEYFTKSGAWDKRRRYFNIEISLYSKSDNPILDTGKSITKVGQFIEKSNNDKVYMIGNITTNDYNSTIRISINFISYDIAAKILLSQ